MKRFLCVSMLLVSLTSLILLAPSDKMVKATNFNAVVPAVSLGGAVQSVNPVVYYPAFTVFYQGDPDLYFYSDYQCLYVTLSGTNTVYRDSVFEWVATSERGNGNTQISQNNLGFPDGWMVQPSNLNENDLSITTAEATITLWFDNHGSGDPYQATPYNEGVEIGGYHPQGSQFHDMTAITYHGDNAPTPWTRVKAKITIKQYLKWYDANNDAFVNMDIRQASYTTDYQTFR